MTKLSFPSGATLETFRTPIDFDIGVASDSALEQFGFGHLIANAPLKNRLASQLHGFKFIEPAFSNLEATPRTQLNIAGEMAAPVPLPAWAGGIVRGSPTDPICWVQGGWTVPSIQLPPNAPPGYYAAAPWVGIDGLTTIDIVQAGCVGWLKPEGPFYSAWCQWHPDDPKCLNNFPVSPGDALAVTIHVDPASRTAAAMVVANHSRGTAANFVLNGSPAYPLVGTCAEWIVERQSQLGLLGNFGIVNFTDCATGAVSGATTNLGPAIPAYMVPPNGRVLAQSAITGPNTLGVRFNLSG